MEMSFEYLLKELPKIAEVVNSFKSEELQGKVFDLLLKSNGFKPLTTSILKTTKTKNKTPAKTSSKKRGGKYTPNIIKDLDLTPRDKQTFASFIEEKKPRSNEDKYCVAVYYLENILEITPVTVDHINTIFRLTKGWKEPQDLLAGLSKVSSRKNTIDTSDMNNITTTPTGRNFVETELPITIG